MKMMGFALTLGAMAACGPAHAAATICDVLKSLPMNMLKTESPWVMKRDGSLWQQAIDKALIASADNPDGKTVLIFPTLNGNKVLASPAPDGCWKPVGQPKQ